MIKIIKGYWNKKQRIVEGIINNKEFLITFDVKGFVVDKKQNLTDNEIIMLQKDIDKSVTKSENDFTEEIF